MDADEELYFRRQGAWLKIARERSGKSQAGAAEFLGFSTKSKSSISDYENGVTAAPMIVLRRLAEWYGVPLTTFTEPRRTPEEILDEAARGGRWEPDFLMARDGEAVAALAVKSPPTPITDELLARRRTYWLRRARERLQMNRDEVDRRLGHRPGTYGRWEDGRAVPQGAQVRRVAELFRVPEAVITEPPETDEERLGEWQVVPVAPLAPGAPEPQRRRRTA